MEKDEMKSIGSKYVASVLVTDPDTKLNVEVEIRKLETGLMVGLDAVFLEKTDDDAYSPYDSKTKIIIPDNEDCTRDNSNLVYGEVSMGKMK